jgi:NAD(P)-dependent dehydrogenase (short-subunit alcohol dehydrogenase family)
VEDIADMSTDLAGLRVAVTGGASGIGRAVALEASAAGARVAVVDRDGDGAAATAGALAGGAGPAVEADVSDPGTAVGAVEQAAAGLGGLDALVACAGVNIHEDCLSATPEAFAQTMAVNVGGTFFCAQAAARRMVEQDSGGAVLMMSSTAAFGFVTGLGPHYHASKAAIAGMARSLAGELAFRSIRVNALAPGPVITPMTERMRRSMTREQLARRVPLGRLIEAEEVARFATFLLSPAAIMISGQVIGFDGAQTAYASMRPDEV